MPYTKGGPYTVGGAFSSANANNLETQYDEATLSFVGDAVAAFVVTGGVCTKNGGNPKQLDVTQCWYYATQADTTKRWHTVTATNFLTVTASTTYFLDYNADGTTSWGTAHSGVANYVPIASVTTDASGNINVITDARPINVNQFFNAVGEPQFAGKFIVLKGTHNGVNFKISAGNGAPGTLDTNEIYFQLS